MKAVQKSSSLTRQNRDPWAIMQECGLAYLLCMPLSLLLALLLQLSQPLLQLSHRRLRLHADKPQHNISRSMLVGDRLD